MLPFYVAGRLVAAIWLCLPTRAAALDQQRTLRCCCTRLLCIALAYAVTGDAGATRGAGRLCGHVRCLRSQATLPLMACLRLAPLVLRWCFRSVEWIVPANELFTEARCRAWSCSAAVQACGQAKRRQGEHPTCRCLKKCRSNSRSPKYQLTLRHRGAMRGIE